MELGLSDTAREEYEKNKNSKKAQKIIEKDMQVKDGWYMPALQYIGGAALVVVINVLAIALSSQNYDQLLPWNIVASDFGNFVIWFLAALWMGLVLYALYLASKDAFKSKQTLYTELQVLVGEYEGGDRAVQPRLKF